MDISFDDAEMAALCNSRQKLSARWGSLGFLLVARHLEALAALDGNDVVDMPAVVIDQGRLTITAVPTKGSETTDELDNADGIRIVSLVVGDLK